MPDGTQSCKRCGGTVLVPVQTPPQQRPRSQGQNPNEQGRGNVPTGQRPQRTPMRRPNHYNSGQPANNAQMGNHGFNQPTDDFFGDGFEEFDQAINQNVGAQQFNNQSVNNTNGANANQQMNNVAHGQSISNTKAKQASKDGSSNMEWLIMMVCMLVPVVNIWYIVTNLSKRSTAPDYKKNYIKAYLIYFVVMSILSFVITALFSDSISYWIASTFMTNG